MAHCYPHPDTWSNLRVELEPGEADLVTHLVDTLDDDWRVYVQPHVAGTRPDVVLVHPRAGVQFIEVKDYDMSCYDLTQESWRVRTPGGGLQPIGDPFTQVDRAREALFRLLLPFAGRMKDGGDRSLFGFTRASVFLSNASPADLKRVRDYLERTRKGTACFYGLASRHTLQAGGTGEVVRLLGRAEHGSRHQRAIEDRAEAIGLKRPWHEVLHGWLHPTPDEHMQNQPLELTPAQEAAARYQGRRLLVTGPPGSGKTLVLAARIAEALVRGQDVLALSFNITLWHYVHDMVARAVRTALDGGRQFTQAEQRAMGKRQTRRRIRDEKRWRYTAAMRRLTLSHYHAFAHLLFDKVCPEGSFHPQTVGRVLLDRAADLRDHVAAGELPSFDLLAVDEAQDWAASWAGSLAPVLREGAGRAMVHDRAQRLYAHAAADAAALFPAEPHVAALSGTARVPQVLLPAVNAARRALAPEAEAPAPLRQATQLALDFADRPDPEARWHRVPAAGALSEAARLARARVDDGVNPNQIACLVATHEEGLALEAALTARGLPVTSVCVEDPDADRSRKHAFWRLDGTMKVCTVHSFKGWEADVVIAVLPAARPQHAHERAALYVALTRSRAVLTCVVPEDAGYPAAPDGWTLTQADAPPADAPPARAGAEVALDDVLPF